MCVCSGYFNCNPGNQEEYSRDGNLVYVECRDCGIIWRSAESDSITRSYDETYFQSKNYEKNRNHKIKKSTWLISIGMKFNRNLKSLLEIGCSLGNTLEAARNLGIDHLGTDISPFAVDFCNKKGLNARVASPEELISGGKQFDLIFMQHVLEHFRNPFDILKKCGALLNENGIILILVPNSKYRRAEKGRGYHRFYSINGVGTEHYAYFNYNTLSRVLETTGFEVIQKNYPLMVNNKESFWFFTNRIYRRSLSLFRGDQEILVVARKKSL